MPTKIEWATESWNPFTGCSKVSEGCANCYAKRDSVRLAGRVGYPALSPFAPTFHPNRIGLPIRWKRPRRIFVCSMSDLFHEQHELTSILEVFSVFARAPQHKFLVLTKRPDLAVRFADWLTRMQSAKSGIASTNPELAAMADSVQLPLPNLLFGVSVENQERLAERIGWLKLFDAETRFISAEPLLGPLDLSGHFTRRAAKGIGTIPGIDWVIVGGESGRCARPTEADWVRGIVSQCKAAGVPVLFKQWGEWLPEFQTTLPDHGEKRRQFAMRPVITVDARGNRWLGWGKRHNGRLLDGRIIEEYPEAAMLPEELE